MRPSYAATSSINYDFENFLNFKNKEGLYLIMIKGVFEDLLREIKTAIESVKNPVDAFSAYIKTSIEYTRKHKELILADSKEQGFTLGIELKQEFMRKQRKFMEKIIREGIISGYFGPCNVKETTKIIIGVLRGHVFSIVIDPDNLFSHKECADLFMKGLLKRNRH